LDRSLGKAAQWTPEEKNHVARYFPVTLAGCLLFLNLAAPAEDAPATVEYGVVAVLQFEARRLYSIRAPICRPLASAAVCA
jgi:hypothetical protein